MHTLGAGAVQQLARLIMCEVHGLRFLERDRTYLIVGRKLTSVIAYSLLKNTEKNEVEREDISRFLLANGYSPSEEDINGIFWRLDHNKDGVLTYQDFCQFYDDSIWQRVLPEGTKMETELLPRDENDNPILPDLQKVVEGSDKGSKNGSKKSNPADSRRSSQSRPSSK